MNIKQATSEEKKSNLEYSAEYSLNNLYESQRNIDEEKNFENNGSIHEQKLNNMKHIDTYRHAQTDGPLLRDCECKSEHGVFQEDLQSQNEIIRGSEIYNGKNNYRKLRNVNYRDFHEPQRSTRRGEGEGSPDDCGAQRSKSYIEFPYTKSQQHYCADVRSNYDKEGASAPISILKKSRNQVPKSHSFSAGCIYDYDLPQHRSTRHYCPEVFRKPSNYFNNQILDEAPVSHDIQNLCTTDHCSNVKCFLDEIYSTFQNQPTCCRSSILSNLCGIDASSDRNRTPYTFDHCECCWNDDRATQRLPHTSNFLPHMIRHQTRPPPPPVVICCCSADDCCCHRQPQQHRYIPRSHTRINCTGHSRPFTTDDHHPHRRHDHDMSMEPCTPYDRVRQNSQDKYFDDVRYTTSISDPYSTNLFRHPTRSGSPICYDEETCSNSTEMDLEDLNIDLEQYWDELEKPPSPIDFNMHNRNMHSNLKLKNVYIGYYNNGQPIEMPPGDYNEQILKQPNEEAYNFFEQADSPLHRSYFNCRKVHPIAENVPTYNYNNFNPEHNMKTKQSSPNSPSCTAGHSALSLINNIFSIYKPNKYAPHNCQINDEPKPETYKKMNVPSTRRPLGTSHSEYMNSMKRPLTVSTEQPYFKIVPEKNGLKISPLYTYDDYGEKSKTPYKFTSTARPLLLPH